MKEFFSALKSSSLGHLVHYMGTFHITNNLHKELCVYLAIILPEDNLYKVPRAYAFQINVRKSKCHFRVRTDNQKTLECTKDVHKP